MTAYGPRYRILEDELNVEQHVVRIESTHPEVTSSLETGEVMISRVKHDMHDINTPRFWLRVKQGEIIVNPMRYNRYTLEKSFSPSTLTYTDSQGTAVYYDSHPEFPGTTNNEIVVVSSDEPGDLVDLAYIDAMAKVDKSNYAFMEDIAEFRKTIDTVKSLFNKTSALHRLLDNRTKEYVSYYTKKYGYKGGDAYARASAKAWLEMRYAFRPIIISLKNIAEFVNSDSKDSKVLNTARSTKTKTEVINSSAQVRVGNEFEYDVTTVTNITTSVTVGIIYNNFNKQGILKDLGLRGRDVPKTLWALMPYSWVMDHFINVSKLIDAEVSAVDPGIQYLGIWETTKIVRTQLTVKSNLRVTSYGQPFWSASGGGSTSFEREVSYSRKRIDPRFPLIHLRPTFHLRTDTAFITDLLSLIIGRKALKDRYD